MSFQKLIIASRKSKLAMWQAKYIQSELQRLYPSHTTEILGLSTKGDESQAQNIALSKIGGKALFTKELEDAMYNDLAHLAIHSLKDVPMILPCLEKDFILGAILPREDARDALISNKYTNLESMPHGSVIGTSSLRRSCILKHTYPHLSIKMLRGNVDTRLAKLDAGDYDAILLASAGLKRLGLEHRITQYIPVEIMLPCAGQAALGIEIYGDKYLPLIKPLNHMPTFLACSAERQVSKRLGGSCQVPIAAYAYWQQDKLCLQAWVLSIDGITCLKTTQSMLIKTIDCSSNLGNNVATELINQGALELLVSN